MEPVFHHENRLYPLLPAEFLMSGLFDVRKEIILSSFRGALLREPEIHTPCRGYGFRACAKWRIPE